MIFNDVFTNKKERFSVGIEEESRKFYLSIPVSNNFVDYEEYYEIDENSFNIFQVDVESAINFIARCRNREVDDLLFLKPGKDRGVPL